MSNNLATFERVLKCIIFHFCRAENILKLSSNEPTIIASKCNNVEAIIEWYEEIWRLVYCCHVFRRLKASFELNNNFLCDESCITLGQVVFTKFWSQQRLKIDQCHWNQKYITILHRTSRITSMDLKKSMVSPSCTNVDT